MADQAVPYWYLETINKPPLVCNEPVRASGLVRNPRGHNDPWLPNHFEDYMHLDPTRWVHINAVPRDLSHPERDRSDKARDRYAYPPPRQFQLPWLPFDRQQRFFHPLLFLNTPDAKIAKQAYSYHMRALATSNRFSFTTCTDLYFFLFHLSDAAKGLIKEIMVEYLTDDDPEEGDIYVLRACKLLSKCTSLTAITFGYCEQCGEAFCSDRKWKALKTLRGFTSVDARRRTQIPGPTGVVRANIGRRGCSLCRKHNYPLLHDIMGLLRGAHRYDLRAKTFDETIDIAMRLTRVNELITSLRRPAL